MKEFNKEDTSLHCLKFVEKKYKDKFAKEKKIIKRGENDTKDVI